MNKRRRNLIVAGALATTVALAGGAMAIASGDDDASERPVRGASLERASRIALEDTGGGRVTGSEVGDEEGAYEIEVTKPDGSQVDVHLDSGFRVIGTESEAGENEDD
ncbi:MAG TPA: PepSY domain-containing protein [Thermoleophilaceae bacterium]|nr:PepSY domain-containing protein [Thermoleophilaceae bacterium]